jgi:hypothetical protein
LDVVVLDDVFVGTVCGDVEGRALHPEDEVGLRVP